MASAGSKSSTAQKMNELRLRLRKCNPAKSSTGRVQMEANCLSGREIVPRGKQFSEGGKDGSGQIRLQRQISRKSGFWVLGFGVFGRKRPNQNLS